MGSFYHACYSCIVLDDQTFPFAFAAVLALSFAVEAAVGFGSALIAVSLGAQLMPLSQLFPLFQPLGFGLSSLVLVRAWRSVDRAFLVRSVLPAMIPGTLVGMALFRLGPTQSLLVGVGVAIALLALFELTRTLRGQTPAPLPRVVSMPVLFGAGIIHGLFGVSGPPVVWVASRTLHDKGVFRATLSALWLVLSAFLLVGYVADGSLRASVLVRCAALSPALLAGFVIGNQLHHRVPQRTFRIAVCVLLLVAGTALVMRNV